jgi:tetratricopeptide (TPR) repeat protein
MNERTLGPHRFRQGRALHGQGNLAAAIAEYEAALALDPAHFDSHHYLGLALHQAGNTKKALEHIRRAIEINPNDLGVLINCGELARSAGMPLEAEVHLNLAIALHPATAEARVNLAALYLNQERFSEAREILRQARELQPEGSALMRKLWAIGSEPDRVDKTPSNQADVLLLTGRELNRRERPSLALPFLEKAAALKPNNPTCWLSVGIAHYDRDDKPNAIIAFAKAAKLDPNLAIAHTNIANAHMELGNETAAAEAYAIAAKLAPKEPLARFNQSLLQLKRNEWPEAWELYDYRHSLPSSRKWPGERWDGGPIKGKRLLVHCEQGVGDTLQFARFLSPLRETGAHITLAAQTSLSQLCSRIEGMDEFLMEGRSPEFDVRIELLSLPHVLKTTPASLPPPTKGLTIPRKHQLAERATALKGRKIGLCWSGAANHKNDWRRSVPLGFLAPLKELPGINLISLQVGARSSDIAAEGWQGRIYDWSSDLKDFADTAALIEALDLVITVDTSVAHLAATIGKPTWIMLPEPGEWRWGEEAETTIWYPSVKLFRQPRAFAWADIADRLCAAL